MNKDIYTAWGLLKTRNRAIDDFALDFALVKFYLWDRFCNINTSKYILRLLTKGNHSAYQN